MRKINKIILHCSATPEGKEFTVEDIDRMHKDRGFKEIGYHFVVYLDGSVHKGRDIEKAGAHVTGENADSIGICYIGGVDTRNRAKDTRTIEQRNALVDLVDILMCKYNLTEKDVHCHYEYANKACPSFKLEDFLQDLRDLDDSSRKEKMLNNIAF